MDSTERTTSIKAHPAKIKKYSCVLCSQRKVKCDRKDPCINCAKAGVECVPSNPTPPRRRKKVVEAGLHERLQRCEDMLKTYGLSVNDEGPTESTNGKQTDTPFPGNTTFALGYTASKKGRMISKPGVSRFIDNEMWTGLVDELREFRDILQQGPAWEDDESDASDISTGDGSSLLFSSTLKLSKPTKFHPLPVQALRLWRVFLENVDPMLKIIHAPTLQPRIVEASKDVANIPKNFESLLFAIYTLAIVSLDEEECFNIMGESKKTLVKRYSSATEHALIRAGTLESSDVVVLQALSLFLVGTRSNHNPQAYWILCGVATRMAQKMGVHRDGTTVEPKLPPFETEMRRRIWWHVVNVDFISAVYAGVGPSLLEKSWDTRLPGNFNDGDLYPEMKELPSQHEGVTEMIYVLMTYELCQAFDEARKAFGFPGKGVISSSAAEKWFNDLEARMKKKFFQYCDPSNPLHVLSEAAAMSIIANKRLYSRHPRNNPVEKTEEGQLAQMASLLENSMTVLRYFCAFHSTNGISKFQWHIRRHFPYDAFVALLSHLRNKPLGPESDQGWKMIQNIYSYQEDLMSSKTNELHIAICELTLKAWEHRELALRSIKLFVDVPGFISVLRSRRSARSEKADYKVSDTQNTPYPAGPNPNFIYSQSEEALRGPTWGMVDFDPTIHEDNIASTDMAPMDWEYWDNLFREYDLQDGDPTGGLIG